MKFTAISTTLVSPMQALTQCSLQTAIMSLRNLWPYWIVHFEHFAQGGRLVVLDRGPRSYQGESRETQMQRFQIALSTVEDEIRQSGFEVISRDDRFID